MNNAMNVATMHIARIIVAVEWKRNGDIHTIMMYEHDIMRLYILISALLLLSSTIR